MLTCTVFWIRPLLEAHYLCIAQDSRPHIPKSVVHAVGQLVQKFVFVSHHVAGVTMSQVNAHVSVGIQHLPQHRSRSVVKVLSFSLLFSKGFVHEDFTVLIITIQSQ